MPVARNPLERFESFSAPCPITGCWIWTGSLATRGYGVLKVNGKSRLAHRWIYEQTKGPIPAGLVLDHYRCDNKLCVNPDHLRPVTNRENVLRGDTPASRLLSRPVCPKCGGEWSQRGIKSGGGRICIPCRKEWLEARKAVR